MFKKFSATDIASTSKVKSSVGRGIRAKIIDQFPAIEDIIEEIIPKKADVFISKCTDYINLVVVNNEILFFQDRDGPYFPSLKLLHKYPEFMPRVQVDRGAIKYVLSGANIMIPGLTSAGGYLPDELESDVIVMIMAEGKQYALAVGISKFSAKEMRTSNKGIGIEVIHYLNDGLWKIGKLEN